MREIFRLYLPLALSFELMMAEAPVVQGAVGRLPGPETNLAAWGLTMSLSLLIESPVIMLLATAIALVKDRPSFLALRRFMLTLALGCTLFTGLVAFTPLFDWLTRSVMGQPHAVADAARLPLQLMLFWSGAIAWRRFFQGVQVRFGQTRWVTVGTALRLISILFVASLGVVGGWLTGAQAAACAIMAGVIVEAIAASLFALPTLRRDLAPGGDALTQPEIWRFHWPLASNTLLGLLAQPLTQAALARLPDPQEALAAWPVVFGFLLIVRGWCFALQEITVARLKSDPAEERLLRAFSLRVGLVASAFTLLCALTPLLSLYQTMLQTPAPLHDLVREGVLWAMALPLLTAWSSWRRGVRVARGETGATFAAMAIGLATQLIALAAAVWLRATPMPAAALAVTLSALTEGLALLWLSPGRSGPKES